MGQIWNGENRQPGREGERLLAHLRPESLMIFKIKKKIKIGEKSRRLT